MKYICWPFAHTKNTFQTKVHTELCSGGDGGGGRPWGGELGRGGFCKVNCLNFKVNTNQFRTTRYLKHFDSTRSSSLSLVSSFSVYTRENSIENLNHNENRPSQSCPTSPTKIALSFDSPLLNKVDFEKSFRLFPKLMTAQSIQLRFCRERQPLKELWRN